MTQAHSERPLTVVVVDDHEIVALGVSQAMGLADRHIEVRHVPTVSALVPADPASPSTTPAAAAPETPADAATSAAPAAPPEALALPATPSVVILDLRLQDGSNPSENLAALRAMGAPVVVYTSADDPVLVREAIAAGALSIVRKSAPPHDLVEAVLAASRGATMPGLDWAAALDADEDFVSTHLSGKEAEVLALYASGESSDVVAHRLEISRNTVNTYVARIRDRYRSVGRAAESRIDLFRRAAEDGLVSYYAPAPSHAPTSALAPTPTSAPNPRASAPTPAPTPGNGGAPARR